MSVGGLLLQEVFQCSFASTFSEFGRALTGLYLDYAGTPPPHVSRPPLCHPLTQIELCYAVVLSSSDTPRSSAVNSINVIDSYFEGKLLIGIVATTGSGA